MQIQSLLVKLDLLDKERAHLAGCLNAEQAATKDIPDDVLMEIFSLLCPSEPVSMGCRNSRSSSRKDHPTADLRRVAQVCSMWRGVALASPALWATSLNCNHEAFPWIKELLRRCKSSPIHITADLSLTHAFHLGEAFKAGGMIDKFDVICRSSPNIGSVSVVYDRYSPLSAVIEDFISEKCTSATRMSFSLHADWRGWPATGGLSLLPTLGKHHLRQLEVNGYHPDLTLSCFRHLAWLSISCLSGITATDWVRALDGLHELTHLRLDHAISSNIPQVGFSSSIKLPSLKTLALIGEFDHGIGDFLLAIDATKKYSLLLHCTLSGKDTNLDLLLCGLQKWFAVWGVDLPPDVSDRRVELMASHSRFRLHNQIPGKELSDEWFRIFLNWGRLSPNLQCLRKLQADIFRVFGPVLTQTHMLSICPDRYHQGYICCPDFWQYFQAVETLRFLNSARNGGIDDSTTGYFVNALCNDIERSTGTNTLPLLRVLSFECENFLDNSPIDCMRSLERLSMLGKQISSVELYGCTGTRDVCNLFKFRVITGTKSPRF